VAEAQQRTRTSAPKPKPEPEPERSYLVRRGLTLAGQRYERGQTVSAEIVDALPRGEALVRSGYLDRSW
jgi:hypothetical protein